MTRDTQRALQGIGSVLGSLLQELLLVALDQRLTKVRKREWAETLRSLAYRVERLSPTEE